MSERKSKLPQPRMSRRGVLKGIGAATAAACALPRLATPALATGISGEIAFATFEWTLPHTGGVLRAITERFNQKYPDVTIREIPIPSTGYSDQILTQLTAGSPPDIFRIDDPQLALYVERGFLAPLDEAVGAAGIDTAAFAAAAQDPVVDGRRHAIVYQTNVRQLIFNRALLDAAGIAGVPDSPESFEAAIAAATNRAAGVFGFTLASKAGQAGPMMAFLAPIVNGFGAHFTTDDGRPNATDPAVIEAIGFVKRLWDGNHVPRGLDGPAANKLTFDGKVAMTLTGSFVFGAASDEVKPHLNAAPNPLNKGPLVRASSWYGVAAQGRNPDAAKAWLMHMLEAENQAEIVTRERVVPAIPAHIPGQLFDESPWLRTFVAGAATARSYLPPGLGSRANAQLKDIAAEIELVLYADKPVETAMADLQATLERNLAP